MAKQTKAVFLDRDGTIIVDKGYVHHVEDLAFIPGAVDGLRKLNDLGLSLVVVTNQSGIARGLFTEDDYELFSESFIDELANRGVRIAGMYHCPHLTDCDCRKPALGMFLQACEDLDIDIDQSYAIGDRIRDLAPCREHATKGFLLTDDIAAGRDCIVDAEFAGDVVVATNLKEAAAYIAKLEGGANYGA